ncbi:uncharacterized protein LOC143545815 [Bidens hawaiensis]|uniref:uncharacterized protein LOC143545815 n=1 Tax=Bidens hawaiensis TaxID=980011 RepID=UPI00404AA6D4
MASNGYLPTLIFGPEQGFNRLPKDSQHILPIHGLRDDVIRSSPLNMSPQQNVGPWKPINELFDNKQIVMVNPTIPKPALIDIQDYCPNSTHFNFKFPMSGLIEVEKDGLDLLSLSGVTGLQSMKTDCKPYIPDIVHMDSQLIYQNLELDSRKPLIDFVGDLVRNSEITIDEDGHVSLTGTKTEMKDILSILSEFYLSKNSTTWRKSLVPHFNRLDYGSAWELETVIVAPLKSPEKVNNKEERVPSQDDNPTQNQQHSSL